MRKNEAEAEADAPEVALPLAAVYKRACCVDKQLRLAGDSHVGGEENRAADEPRGCEDELGRVERSQSSSFLCLPVVP